MDTNAKVTASDLRQAVSRYCPDDVDKILELCLRDGDRFWGDYHMDIFAQLCNVDVESPIVDILRVPYILATNYYFLLDALVDDHLSSSGDILFCTHLLFLASVHLHLAIDYAGLSSREVEELKKAIGNRVSCNARAVQTELNHRSRIYDPNQHDYESVVGRSNSTVCFYEITSILSGQVPNTEVIGILEDLVYFMQLGDDLGDWRKDFHEGNYTLLLQECFNSIPEELRGNIASLEYELYINGVFERYLARLISGLYALMSRLSLLKDINTEGLRSYIDERKALAFGLLEGIISAKVSFLLSSTQRQ